MYLIGYRIINKATFSFDWIIIQVWSVNEVGPSLKLLEFISHMRERTIGSGPTIVKGFSWDLVSGGFFTRFNLEFLSFVSYNLL